MNKNLSFEQTTRGEMLTPLIREIFGDEPFFVERLEKSILYLSDIEIEYIDQRYLSSTGIYHNSYEDFLLLNHIKKELKHLNSIFETCFLISSLTKFLNQSRNEILTKNDFSRKFLTPIEETSLPKRAKKAFLLAKIKTLGDLANLSIDEIKDLQYIGEQTLKEIVDILKRVYSIQLN